MIGDWSAASRALVAAEQDLERAQPATTPPWAAWMSPADLTIDAGRRWLTLGQPQRAEQSLTDGIGMLAPSRQHTRSLALAYRAGSALARRDLDTAAADARSALDTEASRCITLVNDAAKRITSHAGRPAVRDLQDHIAALP